MKTFNLSAVVLSLLLLTLCGCNSQTMQQAISAAAIEYEKSSNFYDNLERANSRPYYGTVATQKPKTTKKHVCARYKTSNGWSKGYHVKH